MAVAFLNPVDGPRIVPYGKERLPTDKLPNGRDGFRVTQKFGQALTQWGPHTGMDLGNFTCGDRVLAMKAGRALAWKDGAGALCVTIDHGNGDKTIYAHLDAWVTVRFGVWVNVSAGQQIGLVGDTGLGAVCHLHVEYHHYGVKKDPWPVLEQNREVLMLKGKMIRHVVNQKTSTKFATNFRAGPFGNEEVLRTFPSGTAFIPVVEVAGEDIPGSNDRWFGGWLYISGWKFGYFHSSGLNPFTDNVERSGFTESQVQAKVNAAVTAALSEAVRIGAAGVDSIRRLIPS